MKTFAFLPLSALLLAATGCTDDSEPLPRAPELPAGRLDLRWKRPRAVERDLAQALQLPEPELCNELGLHRCLRSGPVRVTELMVELGVENPEAACAYFQGSPQCDDAELLRLDAPRGVHLVALGGNDPFFRDQFVRLEEPFLASPIALDRVVLSACARRADLDAAGPAVVFQGIDLGAVATDPAAPEARALAEDMFRRLLARDAEPAEVDAVASIAGPGVSGRAYAALACHAVGTTVEFVFQ